MKEFLKEKEVNDFYKVANIQFGFANRELILKLRDRAKLLTREKMEKL